MTLIEQSIAQVRDSIHSAEKAAGRKAGSVKLLAVSKTRPSGDLRTAYELGQRDFGENYLQEAEQKIQELAALDVHWHFIGHIQSNKTRTIAELFDWVHSIDREKIARRLNDQRAEALPPLNVCLQVNISGEVSKSGIEPDGLLSLARAVDSMPRLRLRGLMALPAPGKDFDQQKQAFDQLSCLQQMLIEHGLSVDTLSMGTSSDMQAAIAAGATMVRIGTAVFGPRQTHGASPAV